MRQDIHEAYASDRMRRVPVPFGGPVGSLAALGSAEDALVDSVQRVVDRFVAAADSQHSRIFPSSDAELMRLQHAMVQLHGHLTTLTGQTEPHVYVQGVVDSLTSQIMPITSAFQSYALKDWALEGSDQGWTPIDPSTSIAARGRLTGPVQVLARIAKDWSLTNDELAALLAYSGSQSAEDLLAGRTTLRGMDRQDRVRMLFQIYRILSRLFVDPNQQGKWLRAPNPMLDDKSPLDVMLNARIPGMISIRNLVDRLAGR